jgi:hypothetical protein
VPPLARRGAETSSSRRRLAERVPDVQAPQAQVDVDGCPRGRARYPLAVTEKPLMH